MLNFFYQSVGFVMALTVLMSMLIFPGVVIGVSIAVTMYAIMAWLN